MRIERTVDGVVEAFLEVKEPQGGFVGPQIVIGKREEIEGRFYYLTEEITLSSSELEKLAKELLRISTKSRRCSQIFDKKV